MATEREPRNYKLKSSAPKSELDTRVFVLCFCASALALLHLHWCSDAKTSRICPEGLEMLYDARSALIRKLARSRSKCCVGQSVSAREALSALGAAPCKASGSDAPFGCICCDMLLAYLAIASRCTGEGRKRVSRWTPDHHQTMMQPRAHTEKYIRDALETSPTA